jgi:hypothetical protein
MTQTEAHRLILDEWHGLPLEERRTEAQAVHFAIRVCRRYAFRCAGDPYQTIKAWLLRDQSLGVI